MLVLRWLTISRATGIGITAGLAALLLWPLYAAWQEPVLPAFAAALLVAAACGAAILWITAVDLLTQRRGARLRPVRAFDVAVGLLLLLPSFIQLRALLGG